MANLQDIVNRSEVGAIKPWTKTAAPAGYVLCDGAAISRTDYADLFGVISTTYGAGNGSTTFEVPDLRGEFIRGFDNGRGVDSGRNVATSQGGQNASHDHTGTYTGTASQQSLVGTATRISESFNQGSTSGIFGRGANTNSGLTPSRVDTTATGTLTVDASHNHSVTVSGTSASQGSEARPRNIAMMYIIKV